MSRHSRDYSSPLKKRFPDFEKNWNQLVGQVGSDLVNYMKERLSLSAIAPNGLVDFKFKIVVDNNFLLGQIKGVVKSNGKIETSLIFRLLEMKSVVLFGPHFLKKELSEKIDLYFKGEERVLAFEYSNLLLEKIIILDAIWTDDWKQAKTLIGNSDMDDVPYLALALDIKSHAIISLDKVFDSQNEVKVWKPKDTSVIITSYHSGFLSIVLTNKIAEILGDMISLIFRFIRDSLMQLVEFILQLGASALNGIAKIPPAVLFILVFFGVIYFDEINEKGQELWDLLKEKSAEIISKLKEALKEIIEFLYQILDILKLGSAIAMEFVGFLISDFTEMQKKINDLKGSQ